MPSLGGIPDFYLTRKQKSIGVTNDELVNCMSKKNSKVYRNLNKALFFMKHGTTIKKSDLEQLNEQFKSAVKSPVSTPQNQQKDVKEVKSDKTAKIAEIFSTYLPGVSQENSKDLVSLEESKDESSLPVDEKSMSHVSMDESKEDKSLPVDENSDSSTSLDEGTTRDVSLEDEK